MKIFSLYQLNIVKGYLQMRPENFVLPRVEGTMEHSVIDFDTRTEIMTNQIDGKVAYVDIKRGKRGKLYADSISYENWDAEAKRIEKIKKGGHH